MLTAQFLSENRKPQLQYILEKIDESIMKAENNRNKFVSFELSSRDYHIIDQITESLLGRGFFVRYVPPRFGVNLKPQLEIEWE